MSYLSWSQLSLYRNDPSQYYVQYVMGIKPPPSREMTLGSIVHQAIAENWSKEKLAEELKIKNFTSDYIRTTADILANAPRYPLQERRILIQPNAHNGLKVPLLAILDGLDANLKKIGEYKTTSSGWTQERVDEHGQLTFYDLVCYFTFGGLHSNELHSLNVRNGKIKTYPSARSEKQIFELRDEINAVYENLIELGWWQRKKDYAKT